MVSNQLNPQFLINQLASHICAAIDKKVISSGTLPNDFFNITGVKYARYKNYCQTGYGLSIDMLLIMAVSFGLIIYIEVNDN